jgi:predicted DNA-binding transcriptional regulator AlpA
MPFRRLDMPSEEYIRLSEREKMNQNFEAETEVKSVTNSQVQDRLLSIKEVITYSGMSRSKVYYITKAQILPSYKVIGNRVVKESDLISFIANPSSGRA